MLGATAGCSLSLSGFTGGDETDGGAHEAGAEAQTPPPPPGAPPPPPSDGGAEADASFCATVDATFCDDFERTDAAADLWNGPYTSTNATLVTAPGPTGLELRAAVPLVTSGTEVQQSHVDHAFPKAQRLRYAYDLLIDAVPAVPDAPQIMDIRLQIDAQQFMTVYLFIRQSGVSLIEQTFPSTGTGQFIEHALDPPVPIGSRARVELEMHLAQPSRLTLRVGGVIAYDAAANAFAVPSPFGVGAGITYGTPPNGPLSVHVDNVVVDVQ